MKLCWKNMSHCSKCMILLIFCLIFTITVHEISIDRITSQGTITEDWSDPVLDIQPQDEQVGKQSRELHEIKWSSSEQQFGDVKFPMMDGRDGGKSIFEVDKRRNSLLKENINLHIEQRGKRKTRNKKTWLKHRKTFSKKKKCKDDTKFDIEAVTTSFTKCYDQNLNINSYIEAYKELNKFFHLMGTVFRFVARDIDEKLETMEKLQGSKEGRNYASVESMVIYETKNKMLNKKNFVNGCRTVLRLHRALEFISSFMGQLSMANYDQPTSSMAQGSYKKTLAKFHPWLLQKGGIVAMYALPTKDKLISRVLSDKCRPEKHEINELMRAMAKSAAKIYSTTNKLYTKYNLLQLP